VKPDRLTPIAIGAALGSVLVAMILDGSNPMALLKPAPLILVFGGTFFVAMAGFLKTDVKTVKEVLMQAMGTPEHIPDEDIKTMVRLAELARREGLLALETAANSVDDPFFKKAIEMTVDGVDPEEIQDILELEIAAIKERHRMGAKFFADMGGFAPTLGIIGTVIGLIHVLANLSNANTIGAAIGSAFTATLWGVLTANAFWLPIANKLKRGSELEIHSKRLILEGILAVQAGNSPRMVQTRLQTYLSSKDRAAASGKGEAKDEAA
jgi:chemotaxis protein MotA